MTYQARFDSGSWRGDLLAYQVDVDSKQLVQPAQWSAGSLLDARPWGANATTGKRTIIYNSAGTQKVFTGDLSSAHPGLTTPGRLSARRSFAGRYQIGRSSCRDRVCQSV